MKINNIKATQTLYGYARVSALDQNEERQMVALRNASVLEKNIYVDKLSGKDFNRPEYRKMVKKMRRGDTLVILSLDRLGRDYTEVQKQWRMLTKEKGINIRVLDMPLLDTADNKDLMGMFISDLVLQILSFVAQSERDNIRERQREGIEAARARGVKFGRPKKPLPDNFEEICLAWKSKEITLLQAAEACQMPKGTFYEKARKWVEREDKKMSSK